MAQTAARTDPYRGFNFRVEIDGPNKGVLAAFSEVSGLTADGDSVDYREGKDGANNVRKLIGLRKYSVITLKRGYTKNGALWDWYSDVATGKPTARRDGTIVLQDETHTDVLYFHFTNGFLNKIMGPDFKGAGNEVAIEHAEIVVENVTIKLAK
jgi:phage tail-like protein